jgi:pimeloyl-ACP methyl ester carboxylesterase
MKLAFKLLWAMVKDELALRQAQDPKPLVIVGHSLGGSLAFLHALRLAQLNYPILGLYTAAEPRIGDSTLMAAADALIGRRFYRIENAYDPVPHLPPTAANAQAFADVFSKEDSNVNNSVRATVEKMNYAPLPGWTLELSPSGFASKEGVPAEIDSELFFLNAIESDVVKSDNVKDVFLQVKKHVSAHLGDSYVCNFLQLVDQGFHPQLP